MHAVTFLADAHAGRAGFDEVAAFAMGFPSGAPVAPFGDGVTGVVLGGSKKEMRRVHAAPDIAGVAAVESARDGSVGARPGPPVRGDRGAVYMDLAIATRVH